MKLYAAKLLSTFALTLSIWTPELRANESNFELVKSSEINWGYLNPLRGDKSPGAANLWGDRTVNVATGMLVRFNKGFSSPPHIHNISYRGVVIHGQMHNDDPTAALTWMPKGSFWTQPAGENHITAANGDTNLIYLEIDKGPYLVKPAKQAFNNGETALNLSVSNMVWEKGINLQGVEETLLWGSTEASELGGKMFKLPAGIKVNLNNSGKEFRAVLISGSANYTNTELNTPEQIDVGSYFGSKVPFNHSMETLQESLLYIRSDNRFTVE